MSEFGASSMSGARIRLIRSGRSTTVITIGMSIERRRMAEVWITLDIPNPATPRVTVAPLSPLRRSILTIAM